MSEAAGSGRTKMGVALGLLLLAGGIYWWSLPRSAPPADIAAGPGIEVKCLECSAVSLLSPTEVEAASRYGGGGPGGTVELRFKCRSCGKRAAVRNVEQPKIEPSSD